MYYVVEDTRDKGYDKFYTTNTRPAHLYMSENYKLKGIYDNQFEARVAKDKFVVLERAAMKTAMEVDHAVPISKSNR